MSQLSADDLAREISIDISRSDSEVGALVALLAVYVSYVEMFPAYRAFAAQMLQDKAKELQVAGPEQHPGQVPLFH